MMRPATLEDSAFFLELRNEPEARRWSRYPDVVTPEVHAAWFPNVLARQQCYVEPKVEQEILTVEEAMQCLHARAIAAFNAEDKLMVLLKREGLLQ